MWVEFVDQMYNDLRSGAIEVEAVIDLDDRDSEMTVSFMREGSNQLLSRGEGHAVQLLIFKGRVRLVHSAGNTYEVRA